MSGCIVQDYDSWSLDRGGKVVQAPYDVIGVDGALGGIDAQLVAEAHQPKDVQHPVGSLGMPHCLSFFSQPYGTLGVMEKLVSSLNRRSMWPVR